MSDTAVASTPPPHADESSDDDSVFDLRVLIPILIGLVSLTIAVMTWRAAQLDENATDNDRQSVSDTVQVAQNEAAAETQLRDDQRSFLEYRTAIENADLMADQATKLRAAGLTGAAQVYEDEASSQRETAGNQATLTFGLQYVSTDDGGAITFDTEQRRADLIAVNRALSKLDPDSTAAKAEELRRSSQWKVGWIVALVGVIVLLSMAQISRNKVLRPALMAVSLLLFVVFTGAGLAR